MVDRTEQMGMFPHDENVGVDLERRSNFELLELANAPTADLVNRDQALWNLYWRRFPNLVGPALRIASDDPSVMLRRSASWILFRMGAQGALQDSISRSDNTNVSYWKHHLAAELTGNTLVRPTAQLRALEGREFDVSIPLFVEGRIQFKGEDGLWHNFVVSQSVRSQKKDTFMTDLVMEKNIQNIRESGQDFIEGYRFQGLSRRTGPNSVVHYYESLWEHDLYPSGRSGDLSKGVISGIKTHLFRTAETDLSPAEDGRPGVPLAVRGIFYGSVFVDPDIAVQQNPSYEGACQIVSRADPLGSGYVNGFFFGTFRGIPVDTDGDGVIEINGLDSHFSTGASLMSAGPATRAYSDQMEYWSTRVR